MPTKRHDNPAGRPRKYASDAERQAAYRGRWAVRTFRMQPETAVTVARLAEAADVSESTMLHSLITFALLNRNWETLGPFGKLLEAGGSNQGKRRRSRIVAEHEARERYATGGET